MTYSDRFDCFAIKINIILNVFMQFQLPEIKDPLAHSMDVLEFKKILDNIAGRCLSNGGRKMVLSLTPVGDESLIRIRQELVEEARSLLATSGQPDLAGLSDVEPDVAKANKEGTLTAAELWDVSQCAKLMHRLTRIAAQRERYPRLRNLLDGLEDVLAIYNNIERFIELPGVLKEDASEKLVQLRLAKKDVHDKLQNKLNSMLEDEQYKDYWQEPLITLRNERFVLPLKVEHKQHLPSVIHDRSASGATLFIEPIEVIPLNNQLREIELEEREERLRILKKLSGIVAAYAEQMLPNLEILHRLDFIVAVAHFADDIEANSPMVGENSTLSIVGARHPILVMERGKESIVPLDMEIPFGKKAVLITGPNMGGKTVALKTAGLLSLMAVCGLPIPAESRTQIPLFKNFFADIGDEQSVSASISSFASHIIHYKHALENCDKNSLVLFDELGSATDPQEGTPLSWALLEHLLDSGSTIIANTHLGGLLGMASAREDVVNAAMEFDQKNISPTYRLLLGVPGRSWANEIAGMLGVPNDILERAKELSHGGNALDKIIADLQGKTREVEQIRRRIIEEQSSIREKREMLEALISSNLVKQKEVERLRRSFEEQRENRMAAALEREIENIRTEWEKIVSEKPPKPKVRKKSDEFLSHLKARLKKTEKDIAKKRGLPKKLLPEQRVFIYRLHKWANVIEQTDEQGFVKVLSGNFPLRIHSSGVDTEAEYERKRHRKSQRRNSRVSYENRKVPQKVDVRGMRPDDAWDKIDRIIDDAVSSETAEIIIVHGKGKGVLRRYIRDKLHGDARVSRLKLPDDRNGGDGATIAVFGEKKSGNENDNRNSG